METVKFGKTGMQVSKLCLGCMTYGVPERGALLLVSVDPPLDRVDVHEGQLIRAGQQPQCAGQLRQQLPACPLQLPTLPQVNERRNEPSVDGARTPPSRSVIAQQVHVAGRVRACGHPGDQAGHLQIRVHPVWA